MYNLVFSNSILLIQMKYLLGNFIAEIDLTSELNFRPDFQFLFRTTALLL